MAVDLPVCECRFAELPDVSADPFSPEWQKLPQQLLCETVTGAQPRQRTWFRAAWNAVELRVMFFAEDNHTWATLTKRDAPLYKEEVVEIFLDPFTDTECYFEIEVNPLNAVFDLVLRRTRSGYRKCFEWDCEGLRTSVAKRNDGWCAELAVPFASLTPTLPALGTVWRANFFRIDRPEDSSRELSAWSPTGIANFHVPQRFGYLNFVR
jgi:Carbohydrate family 9 binding domain-like